MQQDAKKIISKCKLDIRASRLLKIFVQGCFTTHTSHETLIKLDKTQKKLSPLDLIDDLPGITSEIGRYIIDSKPTPKIISDHNILQIYGQEQHLMSAYIKVNNINATTIKTKIPFREIMKNLEIHLHDGIPINKAQFLISDMAIMAKVEKIKGIVCKVIYTYKDSKIEIWPIVIPSGMKIRGNDLVIAHLGYVATVLEKDSKLYHQAIENNNFQMNNKIFSDAVETIIQSEKPEINYRNFCPLDDQGCDLEAIQLKNFYQRR